MNKEKSDFNRKRPLVSERQEAWKERLLWKGERLRRSLFTTSLKEHFRFLPIFFKNERRNGYNVGMAFFQKKETPAENISFCAIATAFDALLSLVGALLPLSAIFTMLIAPLIASLVAYFCKKRYHALYVFAALGISIAVSAWDFQAALFYLLPSLLSGIAYGYGVRKNIPPCLSVFLASVIQFAFFFFSYYLVRLIYQIDMAETLLSLFRKEPSAFSNIAFPLMGLSYSYAASALSHLFFSIVSPKLGIVQVWGVRFRFLFPVLGIFFSGLSLGVLFLHVPTAFVLFGIAVYWSFASFVDQIGKAKWRFYALFGLLFFAALITFPILYSHFVPEVSLGFLSLFCLAICLPALLEVLLGKKNPSA